MTLLFVDSFDHYSDGYQNRKWGTGSGGIQSGGRRGSQCMTTSYTSRATHGFSPETEIIFGTAISQAGMLGTYGMDTNVFHFWYDEAQMFELQITDTGAFVFYRPSLSNGYGAAILARSRDGIFHQDRWFYVEVKYRIAQAGYIYLCVNEEPVAEFIGDTRLGTHASIPQSFNMVGIGAFWSNTASMRFDDVYLCNGSGSRNNDFLGDVRVDVVYPVANSTPLQLQPSAVGQQNYTMVNEVLVNETNWVESSTIGHQDIYLFGDVINSSDEFFGIQINAWARKSDAGLRKMKILTKSGGVLYKSDDYWMNETAFIDHRQIRETDPATGDWWTDAGIDAASFGIEVA